MLKLIDAEEKCLDEYKEAYILSLQEIEKGNIKKHDLMFHNPDEVDIIQKYKDSRDRSRLKLNMFPLMIISLLMMINSLEE